MAEWPLPKAFILWGERDAYLVNWVGIGNEVSLISLVSWVGVGDITGYSVPRVQSAGGGSATLSLV